MIIIKKISIIIVSLLFYFSFALYASSSNKLVDELPITDESLFGMRDGRIYILSISKAPEELVIPSEIRGEKVIGLYMRAFSGCNVRKVVIPDSVVEIGHFAFEYCENLEEVIIPNSVEYIGYRAFSGCRSLKSIVIPDSVINMASDTFYDCTSLEKVSISNSVTVIGSYTFKYCTSLEQIVIPNSVKTIEFDAFYGCSSLTSVYIPYSVELIERSFVNCYKLDKLIIEEDNNYYCFEDGCLFNKNKTELVFYLEEKEKVIVPNTVSNISKYAFYNYNNVEEFNLELPESLEKIGIEAFTFCKGLTKIVIPHSVKIIDQRAFRWCDDLQEVMIDSELIEELTYELFYGCGSLRKINIPRSITRIGDSVFYNCTKLEEINYEGSVEEWNQIEKGKNWNYKVPAKVVHCIDGDVPFD